jgi:diadenosine tetraphosphate (Ap4A) HIT family hydrolase
MRSTNMNTNCPFCIVPEDRIWFRTETAYAIPDQYPLSEGHTLVVPRHHLSSLYDLPTEQISSLWNMVGEVRSRLSDRLRPDGFNIGLNDGAAAGQTVLHAHIHVVPRYIGDVEDPRGGVRWVIPERAAYWDTGK